MQKLHIKLQKLQNILYPVCILSIMIEKHGDVENMKTNFFKKMMKIMNCFAVLLVAQTANAACIWIFHQPKFPQEAEKYCKFK